MKSKFVEEKYNELITTGVLPILTEDGDTCWALEYDNGRILSDSGQCYPDVITEEEAKKLIVTFLMDEETALREIQSLGWELVEDGICQGIDDDSIYYAASHEEYNVYFKTTYGNMCDGVIEDEEEPMTAQEVLNDILGN